MRAFASALAISIALPGAAQAAPAKVASLNLCTDELLLLLARPNQIASVTHLSQSPAETPLWRRARAYPRNDGSLVEVVGLRPDLVLTMGGGARDRLRIAGRLGIPILDLPFPQNLADIEDSIARVGRALGRPEAARGLIERMRGLDRTRPRGASDTIWLGGGGRSISHHGLGAQWMSLAGLRQRQLVGDRVSLEQLLVSPPQVLLRSDYRSEQYSGEQRWVHHSMAQWARRSRSISTDGRLWTCMGPLLIGEIIRLRARVKP